jgi:hypothetical protein
MGILGGAGNGVALSASTLQQTFMDIGIHLELPKGSGVGAASELPRCLVCDSGQSP